MLSVNFNPFPILQTERLVLRQLTNDDAADLYQMRSDQEMMQMIARPLATCMQDVLDLIEKIQTGTINKEMINWAVTLKNEGALIGTIGYYRMQPQHYRAEIGYMLAKNQQGKGIMHEAMVEVIRYGFDVMKLHSIEAVIAPANTASRHVAERAGFIQEGLFEESEFFEGKFISKVVYSLLNK